MNAVKVIPAPLKLNADWSGSIEFALKCTKKTTGAPVDMSTAQEIWFTAKESIDDLDNVAVVDVTKTGGGIVVSGEDNNVVTVTAHLIGASLANAAATLVCDVKVKLANNYIQVIAKGTLSIVQAITQAV